MTYSEPELKIIWKNFLKIQSDWTQRSTRYSVGRDGPAADKAFSDFQKALTAMSEFLGA